MRLRDDCIVLWIGRTSASSGDAAVDCVCPDAGVVDGTDVCHDGSRLDGASLLPTRYLRSVNLEILRPMKGHLTFNCRCPPLMATFDAFICAIFGPESVSKLYTNPAGKLVPAVNV